MLLFDYLFLMRVHSHLIAKSLIQKAGNPYVTDFS